MCLGGKRAVFADFISFLKHSFSLTVGTQAQPVGMEFVGEYVSSTSIPLITSTVMCVCKPELHVASEGGHYSTGRRLPVCKYETICGQLFDVVLFQSFTELIFLTVHASLVS